MNSIYMLVLFFLQYKTLIFGQFKYIFGIIYQILQYIKSCDNIIVIDLLK